MPDLGEVRQALHVNRRYDYVGPAEIRGELRSSSGGRPVACAGGDPVLSAGEITFSQDDGRWPVLEISNQSTGYCPDVGSWGAVAAALDRAAIHHPGGFTHPIVFRLCLQCRQRNIVKDDHFFCAICEAPLPSAWNMDETGEC
jgi:hypothetical protein